MVKKAETRIKTNRALNIPCVREVFKPGEKVFFLQETIKADECLGQDVYFVDILRDKAPDISLRVPISCLDLNPRQMENLVFHKLIPSMEVFDMD